jgi:DNA mismatch repair protein MutS
LKEGSGSAIYGLEVAKAMDLDSIFIDKANTIRRKILGKTNQIIDNNTSVYNPNVIKTVCSICKKPTDEIHHINEQHLADKNGMIGTFHKNSLFNLVQLCNTCHDSVHYGNLTITGYKMTSSGVELEYNKTETKEVKKSLVDENIRLLVMGIYEKEKSIKRTKLALKSVHNMDLSEYKIGKIINT